MMEIERKLKITILLPQICHFCGEEIDHKGNDAMCLVFHSLDGNHDNWEPSNKGATHNGCHVKYHSSGRNEVIKKKMGAGNTGPENNRKGWITRRNRYPPSGFKNHGMKNPEVVAKISGDKSSMRNPEVSAKVWPTRRKRYGSSGVKDPEAWRKAIKEGMEKNNAGVKTWITRRRLYGPTGRKTK